MKAESFLRTPTSRIGSLLSAFRFHPSSFPVVPLAVPFWNRATYRSIVNCLATGNVIDGPELDILKSSVIETLGVADAHLYGSGSLALELALRAGGVGQGDEVVVPAFCCTAVVAPILAVGAVPVLADTGAELNITAETVGAVVTQRTRAVIVPHLFGNPADIHAIIALVLGKNIRVIDDAAQALGAAIGGRPVGSFGDVGILSFGREKVCSGLGGGVVVSRNEKLLDEISHTDLSKPRRSAVLSNCLSTMVCRRWRRWSMPLKSKIFGSPSGGPHTPPAPYRNEAMANLNAAAAYALMQTLRENIAARRARVRAYHELLGGAEGLQLIAHRNGSACLTQVVRVLPRHPGDDRATRVIEALGREGYKVQGSYVPIHLLPAYERCVWERLSHSEKIWPDLVELPCDPDVSLRHVERIAAIVKRSLRA